MKFTVQRHVSSEKLPKIIPRQFTIQLSRNHLEAPETLVLSFPLDRNRVVLSNVARKAICKLAGSAEPQKLAVGGCFTLEALSCLAEAGFTTLAADPFPWTDGSYKQITKATL
jgi:hypothetical protein